MKKLIVFIVVIGALVFWFKNCVQSGNFEKYLDAHPAPALNSTVEYYWGMLLNMADRKQSAAYRLHRVVEKYPKSEYAPLAWVEYIDILDDMGNRARTIEESKKFLQSEYSDHPKAEMIRKKLKYFEQGI